MRNRLKAFIDSIVQDFSPSVNDNVKNASLFREYNKTRMGKGHKTFCYAPSVNMLFNQDGKISVCCHNNEFHIGQYPNQSIKEIWNSEKANELRNHMANYELSHGCEICELDIKTKSFSEVRARHFDQLPRNPNYPSMMEFLLTNTCNLECVMCKGEYSSAIRKNREKLPPIKSPYDKAFIQELEEFIPYLTETRFSGSGEAFSIDMNYEIWEMIINLNPKCLIMVQTNGTILTSRVKDILRRGNFQIGVSLDSLDKKTFEEIRINANFDKVMDNIKYFNNYCKQVNTRFSISTCVMRQNWRELPAFINFNNELKSIATFHKVWFPQEYGLHNLTHKELQEIHTYLSEFDFPANSVDEKTNRNHYRYFVSVVENWMKDAPQLEEDLKMAQSLADDEILPFLKEKMISFIHEMKISESDKKTLMENCFSKLDNLLVKYNEQERLYLLRQSLTVPIKNTVLSLGQYTEEKLFEDTEKFKNNKALH